MLARVADLFARRGYNIVSLAVAPTHDEAFSRITGVVDETTGDDIARGMYYWQGNNQNVKDWLNFCQHTIPRRGHYPAT